MYRGLCFSGCQTGASTIKSPFRQGGRLINNSSAAQRDHKPEDGSLEDASVALYRPVVLMEDERGAERVNTSECRPCSVSRTSAFKCAVGVSCERCKQSYILCTAALLVVDSRLSHRCQCHICCQGANSHDDILYHSLKKAQLARIQRGGCFLFFFKLA